MAYPTTSGKVAGSLLVILGLLSIGFFIPLMVFKVKPASTPGHGIWCGTQFINAGAWTLAMACSGRCKFLMASFINCIIALCFAIVELSMGIFGAVSVDFSDYKETDLDK
ncbi:hypothetical protein CAPTEDRAFT_207477, partial [Capitella teleta]